MIEVTIRLESIRPSVMPSEHLPPDWAGTPRHPELPGDDLGCVTIDGGDAIFYDRDNPDAYIQGEAYSVGGDALAVPDSTP